jgi:hypothetical protein
MFPRICGRRGGQRHPSGHVLWHSIAAAADQLACLPRITSIDFNKRRDNFAPGVNILSHKNACCCVFDHCIGKHRFWILGYRGCLARHRSRWRRDCGSTSQPCVCRQRRTTLLGRMGRKDARLWMGVVSLVCLRSGIGHAGRLERPALSHEFIFHANCSRIKAP